MNAAIPGQERRRADRRARGADARAQPSSAHQDRVQAILKRRARELARPATSPENSSDVHLWAEFTCGAERFAIEMELLRGVAPLRAMAPLPGAAPYVRGIVAWRGVLIPSIDPRRLAGEGAESGEDHAYVMTVGRRHPELALCADELGSVFHLERLGLQPLPRDPDKGERQFVLGVVGTAAALDGDALITLMAGAEV